MNWVTQIFDPATIGGLFTQFQHEIQHPQFWVALTKIIWINVLLSGDNALVIALACRGLQPKQRVWGMVLGAGVAVLLRVIFTGIVATLMSMPYLKLIGGLALLLIAAKLLEVEPIRAVVIEDAISGVQAGVSGNFGLVIGIARKGNADELKHHGAHLVVDDLAELLD